MIRVAAVLSIAIGACGGADFEASPPRGLLLCSPQGYECHATGQARFPRACTINPTGAHVYADHIHDGALLDALRDLGALRPGWFLEGDDCQ